MTEHVATVFWPRTGEEPAFLRGRFSRAHTWELDGGLSLPASASPAVIPAPYVDPAAIDPEEAFVAAIASCHMMSFLYLANREQLAVSAYRDEAIGELGTTASGASAIVRVTLRPQVSFAADNMPGRDRERELHDAAHKLCFIANSVTSDIVIEPGGYA